MLAEITAGDYKFHLLAPAPFEFPSQSTQLLHPQPCGHVQKGGTLSHSDQLLWAQLGFLLHLPAFSPSLGQCVYVQVTQRYLRIGLQN